jgi:hypothetical protein
MQIYDKYFIKKEKRKKEKKNLGDKKKGIVKKS